MIPVNIDATRGGNRCELCPGVAADTASIRCFVHSDDTARARLLAEIEQGGDLWFTQGVTLDQNELDQIMAAERKNSDGRPMLKGVNFRASTLPSAIRFATVSGQLGLFNAVLFEGFADFEEAVFQGDINFSEVIFSDLVDFKSAIFRGIATFDRAIFLGTIAFRDYQTMAESAEGEGGRRLSPLHRGGKGMISSVRFDSANFQGAATSFDGAVVEGTIDFNGATFGAVYLGPMHCSRARIRNNTFTERTRIDFQGSREAPVSVELSKVDFQASVAIETLFSEISLNEVDFGGPSTITEAKGISRWWLRYGKSSVPQQSKTPPPQKSISMQF